MADRKKKETPNPRPRAERPKPKDEPEPMEPVDHVTQELVARVLRRSGLRPLYYNLADMVEDVNLRGLTIMEAAANNKKKKD